MVTSKLYFFRAKPDFDAEIRKAMREINTPTQSDFFRYCIKNTLQTRKKKRKY